MKFIPFFCILILSISCSKSNEINHWEAQVTEIKVTSLLEIFSKNDSEIPRSIVLPNNEYKVMNNNRRKANQIASYFLYKYKIDIRKKFVDNAEGIIILGMFYAAKEQEDAKLLIKSNNLNSFKAPDETMNCFITAVSTLIGISQAKSIWRSMIAGASEETVIAAVSLIGRRVATIIGVATMVYEAGGCLEWW